MFRKSGSTSGSASGSETATTPTDSGTSSKNLSRRGSSSNISPTGSTTASSGKAVLSQSIEEGTIAVDYRQSTYDVQLVDPNEQLPRNYLIIRPKNTHRGCEGTVMDGMPTNSEKPDKMRALGDSLLSKATPREIVERMCMVSFRSSRDNFRALRRMSIHMREEFVDCDLKVELQMLLNALEFPYKHLSHTGRKLNIHFNKTNVFMSYGSLMVECPADLDMRKLIPQLLENPPMKQRITISELHGYNFHGTGNNECFNLYKPARTDLKELAAQLKSDQMAFGQLTGELVPLVPKVVYTPVDLAISRLSVIPGPVVGAAVANEAVGNSSDNEDEFTDALDHGTSLTPN